MRRIGRFCISRQVSLTFRLLEAAGKKLMTVNYHSVNACDVRWPLGVYDDKRVTLGLVYGFSVRTMHQ